MKSALSVGELCLAPDPTDCLLRVIVVHVLCKCTFPCELLLVRSGPGRGSFRLSCGRAPCAERLSVRNGTLSTLSEITWPTRKALFLDSLSSSIICVSVLPTPHCRGYCSCILGPEIGQSGSSLVILLVNVSASEYFSLVLLAMPSMSRCQPPALHGHFPSFPPFGFLSPFTWGAGGRWCSEMRGPLSPLHSGRPLFLSFCNHDCNEFAQLENEILPSRNGPLRQPSG